MAVDFESIRAQSLIQARALGYPVNKSLPLLDAEHICRSDDEVVDRLFAMHCAVACAYNFDRGKARAWLRREAKVDCLTPAERDFLETGEGDRAEFIAQIEGMWALMWAIGGAATLDFAAECANDFVKRVPDLKIDQSSKDFKMPPCCAGRMKSLPHATLPTVCTGQSAMRGYTAPSRRASFTPGRSSSGAARWSGSCRRKIGIKSRLILEAVLELARQKRSRLPLAVLQQHRATAARRRCLAAPQ